MDFNEFKLDLQAVLEKAKSIANIKRDIKIIEAKLPKIKLQGTLNSTSTRKELNNKLKSVNPKVKIDADTTLAEKKMKKLNQQKSNPIITPTVDNSQVVSGLKEAQKETKTLWERFTNGIFGINLIRMGVQEVAKAIRLAVANVKELDAVKTNIQMVSGTSDSGVNAMMSGYNSMAKDLSSTTKDVAEAANEFLRMGESVASTNELIKSSQVLSKVGMIESAESASYLISSLKGYKIAAENSMDVVSKLTSVDLEAAVSAGGLAEALSKCSNIANNSGVAMDRLIGYTATVGETTQKSMSEVGNSFQALLSRMNNIKIGRFIDDETGESLSDTEAVLNKLGIQLRDTEDSYRSFDAVLDDVGSRWKDFSKVEQNAISVAIAGTRQRENFEALMNNWGNALKYAETAANSAGSALKRYGVYQDSIQAKTNELTAAIESLSTNVISEDLYSGIIEATTGVVEFIDKTNLLKSTLAGLVTMGVSKTIASIGAGFITAAKSTAQLTAAMALFDKGRSADNLNDIGAACKGLSNWQLKLILSTKGLTDAQRKRILAGMGVAEAEQQQTLTTLGFAAAEDKATISTFSLKGAFNSLRVAIATNPIGAIVTAVSVATMVFSGFSRVIEEVKQKAKDLGNTFNDTKSDIEAYKTKIKELHNTINDNSSSIEDVTTARQTLMSVQDELIDKFGAEKETIDLITAAISNQSEALDTLTQKQWQETKNEFNDSGFWNGIANWLGGYETNIDRMKSKMEDVRQILSFSVKDFDSKEFLELEQIMKERGWSYQGSLGGFVKYGNLKDVYSELLEIQNIADNIEVPDYFLKDLTKDANEARETIENYGEMWDAYILNDRIFIDKDLADMWHEVNEAYSDYQEAFVSGNQEEIEKALNTYTKLLGSVLNNSDVDDSVKEYFSSMYPVLQKEAEKWEFHAKILPEYDTHALNGKSKSDILQMLQEDGLQYGEQTFNSTLRLASEYGIITGTNAEKVQQLLDLLVEWGILQDDINDTTSEYEVGAPILSISQTIDQLNTQLKPAFDSLQSAYQDIFTDDGFALNSIDILSTCDSIKSKLDEMSDPEGLNLDVDYSAFEDFVRILNNTESTEQDVENAFDSLATSITQAALSGAEDFETMKAALEDLGVVNNEMVAFDALISNTEALKEAGLDLANATYEEIEAFAQGMVSAENYGQAVTLLKIQKILCAENPLDTSGDIMNLYLLANAAGIATDAILKLMRLNAAYQKASMEGNTLAGIVAKGQMEVVKQTVINQFAHLGDDVDFSGATKAAGKAGKDAGKSYKDALKEELSDLNNVISGITGKIDDQISVIKTQKEAAVAAIDEQIDALNEQKAALEDQKKALEDAKDAAVDALEEERDARIAVIEQQQKQLEQQIKLIEKQIKDKEKVIKSIEDEIKAMQDANAEKQRQVDLQKAQYELERLQHQRTILQYSESKGMHYVTNTKDIREQKQAVDDAKLEIEIANKEKQIDLIEKEIDLLNEKKEAINEQISLLDEQIEKTNAFYDEEIEKTEKYYDGQIKAIDAQIESIDRQIEGLQKQREETEKYYETLIENLEKSKSKYEELTEIVEKAELSAALKKLGIDEEALLNGSEEEFQKLKDAYMNVVTQLNTGNDEVLSSLNELSGYNGTAPAMLEDSNGKLDEMNGKLDASNQGVGTVNSSLGETATQTGNVATNISDLNTNLSESNALVTEEQAAFEALKQKINEVVTAINEKITATQAGQAVTGIAMTTEMAYFQLLKEKILEVKESLDSINGTVLMLDTTPVNNLTTAFQLLYNQLLLVSATLGAGMEGQEEGAVSGIASAIQALNEISLEDGIIAQFTNLKTAIDEVTSAISGGGSGDSEGSGENSGGSSKGTKSSGEDAGGESGGGNSLTGAITGLGETASEVIGEPGAEGDGTVIGEFGSMKTAVDEVASAIGSGVSEGSEGQDTGSGNENSLIGSIVDLGEQTEETLGEPGGDGVIGRFEQFKEPIQQAETHVKGIAEGLEDIDGKTVECTIKVTIEKTGGGLPAGIGAGMNLGSATYEAKYLGNAHVEGTALASGNWAVQSNEDHALVGEVGYEIVVRDGKFFTVGDTGPEMFPIKRGDIVFNHEQSVELLKNGHTSGRGKAYADGTVGGGKVLTKDGAILLPLQPGDRMYDLYHAFDAYLKSIDGNLEKLVPNSFYEQNREWNKLADQITYANSVVNNNRNVQQPVVHQQFNITMPNVTDSTTATSLMNDLQSIATKKLQIDW